MLFFLGKAQMIMTLRSDVDVLEGEWYFQKITIIRKITVQCNSDRRYTSTFALDCLFFTITDIVKEL